MRKCHADSNLLTSMVAPVLLLALAACGSSESELGSAETAAASEESAARAVDGESRDVATVAVCDLVLPGQTELLAAFGSTDPLKEAGGITSSECRFNLGRVGFLKVERAPAIMPSVAAWASSYDAASSPAPEVGSEAVYIEDPLQPHVVFAYGGRIWDVGGEYGEGSPPRDALVETALLVRKLLER